MKVGGMAGAIGYIIGAIIILPLILLMYNYFFINKNDAEKYANSYINSYKEAFLFLPEMDPYSDEKTYEFKFIETKLATKNMGRDGSQKSQMEYKIQFDSSLGKYIQITMFDMRGNFWYAIRSRPILIKVNKDDLNNPSYGTKEKPLLAFSVRGANGPLLDSSYEEGGIKKYYNLDTSPEQYKYNVLMYLTYVMPKKEFKERFEK